MKKRTVLHYTITPLATRGGTPHYRIGMTKGSWLRMTALSFLYPVAVFGGLALLGKKQERDAKKDADLTLREHLID